MVKNELPIVAIVGQPNAGKSTLLNKIAGRPLAVTSEVAGTTRDRQYVDAEWNGSYFTLVDTAGLALTARDELEHSLNRQIEIALAEADVVIFVVDGKETPQAVEKSTLNKFRKTKKPLLLCVNKLDSAVKGAVQLAEFQRLGVKPMFGVSSVSGRGIGDLLDAVAGTLEKMHLGTTEKEPAHQGIAVSIVGKPNVGKSSIFNAILKEQRVVVSPIPGTTRTAIDSPLRYKDQDYVFIDTAGLKKKEHRQAQPDIFSGFQTFKAIRRSDVSFFVIDAAEEITKQDQAIASEIFSMQKGCIILANKIDLLKIPAGKNVTGREKKGSTDDQYKSLQDYVSHHFPFLWHCPVFFVSALTGKGLDEALSAIEPIFNARHTLVPEEKLKTFLTKKMKQNEPKLLRDQKKPKVFGLTQTETNPPKFELLVNYPAAISQQFRKFLENGIIKDLGFWGTPITLKLKGKDKS